MLSVSYEGEELPMSKPVTIILKSFGVSDIVSLGIAKRKELGIQLEYFPSNLGDSFVIVQGRSFFIKDTGRWEVSNIKNFASVPFKRIIGSEGIRDDDFDEGLGNFTARRAITELSYTCRFRGYIIRKREADKESKVPAQAIQAFAVDRLPWVCGPLKAR